MSVLSALPSLLPSALPTALPTALPSALPLISGVTYTLAHSTVKNLLFQVANVYDNGTDCKLLLLNLFLSKFWLIYSCQKIYSCGPSYY